MPGFFLTLMACLAALLPGREAVSVARLAARLGTGTGLLVVIAISAAATSAAAAWAGTLLAPMLPGPARLMFVAMALLLAALDLAVRRPRPAPVEPTRSAGAILLVLLASQLTDSARFCLLALTVWTAEPVPAAAGGAFATMLVLGGAALAGEEWEARLPLRVLGWVVAGVLLLFAVSIGLAARGIIG